MQCAYVRDGSCFLLRSRRRAEAAHLLVVNHALLLSDIAAGGGVLPEYQHLIVDEAHHLEERGDERQFGFTAGEADMLDWLDALYCAPGATARAVSRRRCHHRTRASQSAVERRRAAAGTVARRCRSAVERARESRAGRSSGDPGVRRGASSGRNDYDDRICINRGIRVQPDWADIEAAWFDARGAARR